MKRPAATPSGSAFGAEGANKEKPAKTTPTLVTMDWEPENNGMRPPLAHPCFPCHPLARCAVVQCVAVVVVPLLQKPGSVASLP